MLQQISPEKDRLIYEIKKIGADPYALKMWEKGVNINIKLKNISYAQANIIKQEAIASGIDAVVSRGTVSGAKEKTDILILGNINGVARLVNRLKLQPFGLEKLAEDIIYFMSENRKNYFLARDKKIELSKTVVMGILNATPDSFSDGGEYLSKERIDERLTFLNKYSDIIDIGGESTRPGAVEITDSEEKDRISYPLERALELTDRVISVDTTKSKVAEYALNKGAHLINDISGLTFDADMARVCADFGAAVCIMHIKGRPKDMQENTDYVNMLEEIKYFLYDRIDYALKMGIDENKIIIDPGIGFGKSLEDNYVIIKYLSEFEKLGFPLLIGLSRKSLIGKVDGSRAGERDLTSKALEAISVVNGADIIRTHDVESLSKILTVVDFYKKVNING
ncbi:dihydropteroate synthase [Deferribacterales bacterium Es71-Z0220]|uniref:dihydropteroate synthase n=1 Tax=Deferrivibrio essentukiensis TaxID=2880922 RepID=UPI001F60DB1A|nr:dihydropteroate synthase [Deferrivibrio essentukiensis]MBZ4671791.1 folP [Deferribacteraceae bacterium]MCB4204510.1 dihydropteroate synthase [Deferrivibrio essentukiensis]